MDSFKDFLAEFEESQLEKLASIIGGEEPLVFFFKKGKEIYGGPEDSRLVFAKIKNPDKDDPKAWGDEAAFHATNLLKDLKDQEEEESFCGKDLKGIKVIDGKDELEKLLSI